MGFSGDSSRLRVCSEPNAISEGHLFVGTPDRVEGNGNGAEEEMEIDWNEAPCDRENEIRIDGVVDRDGEYVIDYLCRTVSLSRENGSGFEPF